MSTTETQRNSSEPRLRRPAPAATPARDIASFRLLLQNELVQRCRTNPRYSLRAFAKYLRIDHSTLSQFLRGKRKLSKAIQLRLSLRLGLSPTEVAAIIEPGDSGSTAQAEAHELSDDIFQMIADWYHYAIFELVTVSDFRPDARWIARALGITASEVHAATERLFRLGLVREENGRWVQGQPLITTTGNPFTTIAFRKLQAQVLQMGLKALEDIPMERRDQTSMTMAIHSRRLPEAKERIKKFRRELCEFLQQDQERDSVYQLGVSFYPLTSNEKEQS